MAEPMENPGFSIESGGAISLQALTLSLHHSIRVSLTLILKDNNINYLLSVVLLISITKVIYFTYL